MRMENSEIREMLVRIEKKMDERFESVDKRFEKIDARFEGVEGRLDRSEKMLKKLITIVGATNEKLTNFQSETNSRFDYLDRQLKLHDADYELLTRKLVDHEREINRIKSTIN
ncbi:hypothetical protein ACJ2A9_13675 [Anaerobacillus sp. MEB173]|uniref:hypothetical protein n=1 Tax=Anaerobacillus sp. MEB173 TaxID=3383345 RepID=UPI003F8DEDE1